MSPLCPQQPVVPSRKQGRSLASFLGVLCRKLSVSMKETEKRQLIHRGWVRRNLASPEASPCAVLGAQRRWISASAHAAGVCAQKRLNLTKTVRKLPIHQNLERGGFYQHEDLGSLQVKYDDHIPVASQPPPAPLSPGPTRCTRCWHDEPCSLSRR